MGTLNYFSPEMLSGKQEYDQWSDVYALGVVMYYLLEGKIPFEEEDTQILKDKIVS